MRIFIDASLIIYLNIPLPESDAKIIEDFYKKLLREDLYTDVLALDEAIYVSKKKYGIDVKDTIVFIDSVILPYVEILSLGNMEYLKAREYILKYNLKPSDALHMAVIDNYNLQAIATEDSDYDRTHVKRIWVR